MSSSSMVISVLRKNFWAPAAAVAIGGFLFTFIAAFPGLMSWDSFVMWNMGVEWVFHDWHHPFIGVLMRVGSFFRDDPAPYLFFQLGLVWAGIYMFTLALRRRVGNWAIVAALLGLLPFNLSLFGYLHKTPLLTACFFFSCSWLFLSYSRGKHLYPVQVSALVLVMFVGSVIRGYSYVAALPILAFMVWLVLRSREMRSKRVWKIVAPIILVVVYFGTNHLLVYQILDAEKRYKASIVYRFDLAAMHALTEGVYGEEFLKDEYRNKDVARKKYCKEMERSVYTIIVMYRRPKIAETVGEMRDEWWRAVTENPDVYFWHRVNTALICLGATERPASVFTGFATKSRKNIYNLEKWDNKLWRFFKDYMQLVKKSFFMMPWFWILLNVAFSAIGLVLVLKERFRSHVLPHCVMLWSGFLLMVPYLLVCLSPDTRFTHWVTVATSFGGFGLLSTALSRWRELRAEEETSGED